MTREVETGGHKYRTGTLNAKQQFHIVRRLGKVAAAFSAVIDETQRSNAFKKSGEPSEGLSAQVLVGIAEPFLNAMAELPDADADYVINACLAVVSRGDERGTWATVCRDGQMMFADMGLADLLKLTWNVLEENLGGFFVDLSSLVQVPAKGS